jgi:hypothetical protein
MIWIMAAIPLPNFARLAKNHEVPVRSRDTRRVLVLASCWTLGLIFPQAPRTVRTSRPQVAKQHNCDHELPPPEASCIQTTVPGGDLQYPQSCLAALRACLLCKWIEGVPGLSPRRRLVRTNWAALKTGPSESEFRLPLTREEVLAAERRWGAANRCAWLSQWSAIETVAGDIWRTSESDTGQLHRLWLLLAYAVGNFKRQGNTAIHPLPAPWNIAPLKGQIRRRDSLVIPANGARLELRKDGTTESLGRVTRGLASVPTGSTILSALWPGDHVIMDSRDFQATVGLLAHRGAPVLPVGSAVRLYAPDWTEYRWFRPVIKAEASRLQLPSVVALERALYVAYDFAPGNATSMSWDEWGGELKARLTTEADQLLTA